MSINYIEKGSGLHAAISAAGHRLVQADGEWVSSDDAAVQAIIDAYDPLPEARARKWLQVQAERDRRKHAGFLVAGNRFHSDPDSRIQQLGLVIMGANLPAIQWKTLGGGFVTMTPALAIGIFQKTAQADTLIFAAAEAHRSSINSLMNYQEVDSYDFSGGWPEV